MTAETKAVAVPQALYQRLERLANLSGQSLESLVAQTLAASIPPIPDDLPPHTRESLRALEHDTDTNLWQTMREQADTAQLEQWERLRDRQRHGTASQEDIASIAHLRSAFDLLTLRKAYAAVILKWRGHRIPSPTELEA
jgi:hypothetical protein